MSIYSVMFYLLQATLWMKSSVQICLNVLLACEYWMLKTESNKLDARFSQKWLWKPCPSVLVTCLAYFSALKTRRHVPTKCQALSKLYNITSQQTVIFRILPNDAINVYVTKWHKSPYKMEYNISEECNLTDTVFKWTN